MPAKRKTGSKKETKEIQKTGFSLKSAFQKQKLISPKNITVAVIIVLAASLWFLKRYFIVATVNGQPISRWQLNEQLYRRYGSQVLDNLVVERLILAATRQKKIFISANEIDSRTKDIEEKLKGKATLEEALKLQGLSKDEFRRQIEIQLSLDKLFDKEATVSKEEVEDYLKKNEQTYKSSTNPAALREEVTDLLRQQKIADLFDAWFTGIRKDAKVVKYL